MKKNIAFVSLKSKFCKNLCKMFCDRLELMFADISDILQYNMINSNMLRLAGKSYFDSEEQKVIKNVVDCENIGVNIDFITLNKGENLQIVKNNCLLVYLCFGKDVLQKINKVAGSKNSKLLVAFNEEDKICKSFADIVVEINGNETADIKKITQSIKKYYKL
jgi:shikimate kinase